jgi:hypothetical protein
MYIADYQLLSSVMEVLDIIMAFFSRIALAGGRLHYVGAAGNHSFFFAAAASSLLAKQNDESFSSRLCFGICVRSRLIHGSKKVGKESIRLFTIRISFACLCGREDDHTLQNLKDKE